MVPVPVPVAGNISKNPHNYVETWQFVHSSMIDRPNRGGAIRGTTTSRHEIYVIDRLRFMTLISHDCESAMKCYA